MKPGDDDVAKPPDLVVPLGQEAEYLPMVGGLDRSEPGRAESGNGHRQRIVGVVLIGSSRSQHPHPRGQRRRHIEDLFARADELLGQEITHATGGLDGPSPLAEGLGPGQQLLCLLRGGSHPDLGQLLLITADGHCGVGCLVGVDPDDDGHWLLPSWSVRNREGTPGLDLVLGPLSSHSRRSPDRQQLVRKPVDRSRRLALREPLRLDF